MIRLYIKPPLVMAHPSGLPGSKSSLFRSFTEASPPALPLQTKRPPTLTVSNVDPKRLANQRYQGRNLLSIVQQPSQSARLSGPASPLTNLHVCCTDTDPDGNRGQKIFQRKSRMALIALLLDSVSISVPKQKCSHIANISSEAVSSQRQRLSVGRYRPLD